jgi:hypothetical protein
MMSVPAQHCCCFLHHPQADLYSRVKLEKMEERIAKIHAQCTEKLQAVHTAYTKVLGRVVCVRDVGAAGARHHCWGQLGQPAEQEGAPEQQPPLVRAASSTIAPQAIIDE